MESRKRQAKNRKKRRIAIYLLIALCLLAVYPCYHFMNRKESYTLGRDMYQMVNGKKVVYAEGETLVTDDDGNVTRKGSRNNLGAYPLYAETGERILLPDMYEVIFPKEKERLVRANYFSEIYQKDNVYFVEYDGHEAVLRDGFLFDGENTYIFLEPVTLSYQNTQVNLSPMSYVTVAYGQDMMYYDKESDMSQTVISAGEVTASLESGVDVRLDTDTLITGDEQQLLYGSPENLELLKE